jgi:putative sterol carrier protein
MFSGGFTPVGRLRRTAVGVKYLTDEWASAVTEALNSSDDFKYAAANQTVKLQQVVTDTPGGDEAKYYFRIEGGTAEVALGELADAEATLTQNYDTSVAILKEELNAQNAFMQGKLKIQGNMMKLMQLQGVFNAMPKATTDVDVEY